MHCDGEGYMLADVGGDCVAQIVTWGRGKMTAELNETIVNVLQAVYSMCQDLNNQPVAATLISQ